MSANPQSERLPERCVLARVPSCAARFTLVASILPTVHRALPIAESCRVALMSRGKRRDGTTVAQFSGKDPAGQPLEGNRHAYFLPCDDDGDGRIDHLLVWSPVGFDAEAMAALRALDHLWADRGEGQEGAYRVALVGMGHAGTFGSRDGAGPRDPVRSGVLGESRVWRTETPFMPFRHAKRKHGAWVDTVEEQVLASLGHLPHFAGNLPEVRTLSQVRGREESARWARRFIRTRLKGGGSLGSTQGEGVELRFAEPVRGPILLGYAAHFGLGCFRACHE